MARIEVFCEVAEPPPDRRFFWYWVDVQDSTLAGVTAALRRCLAEIRWVTGKRRISQLRFYHREAWQ